MFSVCVSTFRLLRVVTASFLLLGLTGCEAQHSTATSHNCAGKQVLEASGSTAQTLAMARFTIAYETACPGRSVDYIANGSGQGVSDFSRGRTDFAGTDSPVLPRTEDWVSAQARCGGHAPRNLPLVFGPIAITYNIFGVDSLILDPPAIAKIFTGKITFWDAPEIVALNADQQLPHQPIVVFFRSDDSGTTDNFQRYLQVAAGAAWDRGVGENFHGGVGLGRRGNDGTSAEIAPTPGSITYSEWSFAQKQGLPVARVITSAGSDPVTLSVDSVTASVANVKVIGDGNDLALDMSALYQPTQRGSYPIVLATYEIVCSHYSDQQVSTAVKAFLTVAMTEGQLGLASTGYVSLTAPITDRLRSAISAIT